MRQLQGENPAERRQAIEDLRHIGWYYNADSGSRPEEQLRPIVDTLRRMIRDEQEPLRIEAIDVVADLSGRSNSGNQSRSPVEALPDLVAVFSDHGQDEQVRAHAVDALRWFGPASAPALAEVLFASNSSIQIQLLASRSLRESSAGRRELHRALDNSALHNLVRRAALQGICEHGGPECAAPAADSEKLSAKPTR